ncbi:MAG: electron transport complex protein RnfG [Oleiphilaceae bacterium]|jgi:electron transport complex protein RnfG
MAFITEKIKQNLAYPAILMGSVTLVVCTLLLLTNNITAEPIAQRQREDLTKLLNQVLPSHFYDNQPLDNKYQTTLMGQKLIFYRAKRKDNVSAIILFTKSAGYSGDISLLVAITADANVSGVRVLSHTETPGLGDKIELPKSNWILSFNGLSLSNPTPSGWAVTKDGGQFDAFSGATITPRAVIKGVYSILQQFKENKSFFLQINEPTSPSETSKSTS